MANAPVGVALVGYGYAGRTFHAPLIRVTAGLELRVVVSGDPAKVHADHSDVAVVRDSAEAFEQPDVDLIVVATPNDSHAPLAIQALERGKHVVVDKPFTVTLEEARHVVSAAKAAGRLLSVFQNRRWDADFLGLQGILADGALGDLVHFESHFDRFRPQLRDRWRERMGSGAGLWLDLGPHLADQVIRLFGMPRTVLASLASQRAGAVVDDWAHVVLDYGRLRVILHASVLVAESTPRRFVAHGTAGSWIKHGLDVQESQLLAGMKPGGSGWGVDPLVGMLHVHGASAAVERAVPAGDYGQYYARVRDAIRGSGPNPVTPDEAISVMTVLAAAQTSGREGRVVQIP
jgi:predicted dehydrogenase